MQIVNNKINKYFDLVIVSSPECCLFMIFRYGLTFK